MMRSMTTSLAILTLVATLVVFSPPGLSLCGGGSGTGDGHDHGRAEEPRSETKAERTIRRLLAEEETREVLLEAVLADADFMRDLIEEIALVPEWRALATERFEQAAEAPETAPREEQAKPAEAGRHSH